LKIIKGTQASRINFNEPQPRDIPASPPEFLSPLAQIEWRRIAPDLNAMGVTKAVDSSALAAYCECWARWRTLAEISIRSAPLIKSVRDGSMVKNPVQAQVRDASSELRLWCREFGLTPAARASIHADEREILDAGPARLLS
jgi:P27 family predicted phage terminase small subunit